MGSLQILIFYLAKGPYQKNEEKIKNIISNSSQYLKLSKVTENFFKNEGSEISIDKLMNLFFIFEHLCFKDLIKSLQSDLKLEIPDENKELIKNKLLENYDNKLYSIKDLGAAVRRYISRYLIGLSQKIDVDNIRKLDMELTRQELWESNIFKNEDFEKIVINNLKEFDLNVGQAYKFYELIGTEDKNEILFLNNEDNSK